MAILHKMRTSLERKPADGRKTRSLQINDSKPLSGVFLSGRALEVMGELTPPTSCSSLSADSNSSILACSSWGSSWKSSGSKTHHRGSAVVATTGDGVSSAEKLDKVISRRKFLPEPWYFSSNHVLVNRERTNRTIDPLVRMRGLDELARIHAAQMAEEKEARHLNPDALRIALGRVNCRRLGTNVQMGPSIRDIHDTMMLTLSNKNNILDRRFTHMGMGTATDETGTLYLCQIYRG